MIATTIEQAITLLTIGLSPDTADMHYVSYGPRDILVASKMGEQLNVGVKNRTPAWSLSALMSMMPDEINGYKLSITRWFDPEVESLMWSFTYSDGNDMIIHGSDINETDAVKCAVEMIVWLKTNMHLK